MTPETYIPITPATRIPFPCWLWNPKANKGRGRWFKANVCADLSRSDTHYCTSATEPTGRPGEEDDGKAFRRKFTSILEGSTEDSSPAVPTASWATNFGGDVQMTPAKDEPYKNTLTPPPIPSNPASGATGEGFMQLLSGVVEAERMVVAGLSSEMPCRKMHENRHRAFREALSMAKSYFASSPDSRPAVAQEGVRDTERLTWILEYISFHGLKGLEKITWSLYDENGESMNHHKTVCEDDVADIKLDRAALDRAMSSQPEGRG